MEGWTDRDDKSHVDYISQSQTKHDDYILKKYCILQNWKYDDK